MQRYFALDKKDNTFILNESDYYHIKTVMRMKDNEDIEVVYNNSLYICNLSINEDIKVNIKEKVKEIDKDINVTLILPLLKEQKQDLIIQKSTELGVKKLVFLNTERTIVKIEEKKKLDKLNRWYKIAKEASEQSKRLDISVIELKDSFKDLENTKGINLVCDTKEVNFNLNKIGFKSVSLGNRILRVETVPLYILSIINYEVME